MSLYVSDPSLSQCNAPPLAQKVTIPEISVLRVRHEPAEDRRKEYGILVLSVSSGKVLYVNETASRYLETANDTAEAFASAIEQFVQQMRVVHQPGRCKRPPIETARLVKTEGSLVLLKAFGLLDGSNIGRVVITLEDCASPVTPLDVVTTPPSL